MTFKIRFSAGVKIELNLVRTAKGTNIDNVDFKRVSTLIVV